MTTEDHTTEMLNIVVDILSEIERDDVSGGKLGGDQRVGAIGEVAAECARKPANVDHGSDCAVCENH